MMEQLAANFTDCEWEFLLSSAHSLLKFLRLKNLAEQRDIDDLFDMANNTKNMFMPQISQTNLTLFIVLNREILEVTGKMNQKYALIESCYAFAENISRRFPQEEGLWADLFGLLQRQTSQTELEVRNTALDIFAGIIGLFGNQLPPRVWRIAIEDIYLRLFDSIFEIFLNLMREDNRLKNMPGTIF